MKKIISLLLVISLVLPLAIPVSAALAPDELDLSQYTLEDIMAMSNEEYEALLGEFERVYDPFDTYKTAPIIEPDNPKLRWTSGKADETNGYTEEGSHEGITAKACEILMNDKGFFESDAANAIATILVLSLASLLPDRDLSENDNYTFKGHFYSAIFKTNYLGSRKDTALTNTKSHYDKAVAAAKSGDMNTAYKEIGMGLHYLQDASEPHHAANITAVQYYNVHGIFEKYADNNIMRYFNGLNSANGYDFGCAEVYTYDIIINNDIEYLVGKTAMIAYVNSQYVKDESNQTKWDSVAEQTICNAAVFSAFLLYKFARESGLKMYPY